MKPLTIRQGLALWGSRDDGGYYWQDDRGWGNKTSQVYKTITRAIRALEKGTVKLV